MMAECSVRPLANKLGIKQGFRLYVKNPPDNYDQLLAPLPDGVKIMGRLGKDLDMIHFFVKEKNKLASGTKVYMTKIKQDGIIWVSWPKKSSKVKTDITENVIREVILPLGLVDIKVCAVDEVWSGLKLVIRKENRN